MEASPEAQPSVFIGLTGGPGSGKTAFSRYLDSLTHKEVGPELDGYADISVITMRGLLRWHAEHHYQPDPPNTQQEMQDYHAGLRAKRRGHEIWQPLQDVHNRVVVIDAIREPSDLIYFRRQFGGYVIWLVAPLHIRYERFMTDNSDLKHTETAANSPERKAAWHSAMREMDSDGDVPGSSYIKSCLEEADRLLPTNFDKSAVFANGLHAVNQLLRAHQNQPERSHRQF